MQEAKALQDTPSQSASQLVKAAQEAKQEAIAAEEAARETV